MSLHHPSTITIGIRHATIDCSPACHHQIAYFMETKTQLPETRWYHEEKRITRPILRHQGVKDFQQWTRTTRWVILPNYHKERPPLPLHPVLIWNAGYLQRFQIDKAWHPRELAAAATTPRNTMFVQRPRCWSPPVMGAPWLVTVWALSSSCWF
jgi:hypothetical protein